MCFHDLWVLTTLSTGPIYFWNTCSYNVPRIGAITLTSSPNLTKPRLRAISAETGILPGLDGFQESTSSLSYSCHSQQWGLAWSCGMKLVGVEVCKLACFFVNIFCICVRFEEWQREGKKIDMLDDTGAYNMFKYDMIWYDMIQYDISYHHIILCDMICYIMIIYLCITKRTNMLCEHDGTVLAYIFICCDFLTAGESTGHSC